MSNLRLKNKNSLALNDAELQKVHDFLDAHPETDKFENPSQLFRGMIAMITDLENKLSQANVSTGTAETNDEKHNEALRLLNEKIATLETDLQNEQSKKTTNIPLPSLAANEIILPFSDERVAAYFKNEIIPEAVSHNFVKNGGDLFAHFLKIFQYGNFTIEKPGFIPSSQRLVKDYQ